jgi:hypothetical protein
MVMEQTGLKRKRSNASAQLAQSLKKLREVSAKFEERLIDFPTVFQPVIELVQAQTAVVEGTLRQWISDTHILINI